MNKKRWSKEEDTILDRLCKENPRNIIKGCRIASEKLNRSVGACSARWYTCLSNPESKHYTGVCFVTISSRESYTNRVLERTSTIYKQSIFRTIFNKVKTLLKLH